jgi:hypothetical protein
LFCNCRLTKVSTEMYFKRPVHESQVKDDGVAGPFDNLYIREIGKA